MKARIARLLAKLKTLSPATIGAIGLVYVLAVALIDYASSERLSFTLFYLLGAAFVGWAAGKRPAAVVSLAAALGIIVHDWEAHHTAAHAGITLWNIARRVLAVSAAGWVAAEFSRLTRTLGRLVEQRTARWKAEARRHQATSETLRVFLDALPEPAFLLDPKGCILAGNQALARALNQPLEGVVGQEAFGLIPPRVAELRKERFEQVLRSAQGVQYEDSRNGRHLMSFQRPVLDGAGQVSCVAVLALDITERKRAEQRLADALELNQKMLAASPMGIAVYKASGQCVFCNEALVRIVGGSVSQILAGNFRHLASWQESGLLRLAEEALAHQQPRSGEIQDTSRFGRTFWVDALMAPFVSGGEAHLLHMCYDITERKRLEGQILEISDREQARMGQDLHDGLCQQLVSLAFDANSLARQFAAPQPAQAALGRRLADGLDQAITEARQLSRGLFPIRLEADGLPSALEELARSVRERSGLECHFESRGLVVVADRVVATHLYRIAQEAVNNALKHAGPRRVSVRLQAVADALELTVEDDGCGLPAGGAQNSAGMGLHIMAYRARSIGGVLRLGPGAQGGTTVTCRLRQSRLEPSWHTPLAASCSQSREAEAIA